MREAFLYIKQNQEVRQNLIAIKTAAKDPKAMEELRLLFAAEPEVLFNRLSDEDAKVRKNAALILGMLGTEDCRRALLAAYGTETQRYVKSAYLTALKGCDCEDCLDFFKERKEELLAQERTEENEKHIREELEALNGLIYQYESSKGHRFIGYATPVDVILITHRAYREVTARQISCGHAVLLKAGVKVLGANLEELLLVRTWKEMLFPLEVPEEVRAESAAEQLTASNLLDLLETLHEGEEPFLFRIECKSCMTLEERSAFTKKLASRLETATGGKLVNSTSDYEVELRLVETKNGGFLPFLKLYTLPEKRFAYRKNSVAASIQPVQAALLMELAKPYLKENARVLDPFCGVGTMLLERNYLVHADTLYGVDFYGPAIAGARENAQIAKVPTHFVQKDFLGFTHAHLFDEIVTNMPVKGKKCTGHELDFLYGKLFDKAEQMVNPGGVLLIYSHDKTFVKKQLREHKSMELLREWLIGDQEGSWFFAIRYTPANK